MQIPDITAFLLQFPFTLIFCFLYSRNCKFSGHEKHDPYILECFKHDFQNPWIKVYIHRYHLVIWMDTFQIFVTCMKIQYQKMEFSRIQKGESCNLQIHKKNSSDRYFDLKFSGSSQLLCIYVWCKYEKNLRGWLRSG